MTTKKHFILLIFGGSPWKGRQG